MKKVLSIVLSIAMVLCMMPAMAFAGTATAAEVNAAYSDTDGLACEGAVNVLSALGVVNGYSDGTFKPEQVVTRAEMAKLIVTALGVDTYATATTSKFTDMGAASWAIPYVEYASNLNIVNGYGYGLFGPNDTVTYEQAATMIVRALGFTDECNEMNGSWPAIYIQKATALGIFQDVQNGGAKGADRGDVAIMLYNALDVAEVYADKDGQTNYKKGYNGSSYLTMMDTLNKNGGSYYKVITSGDADTALQNINEYVGAAAKVTVDENGDVLAVGDIKSVFLTGDISDNLDKIKVDGVNYSLSSAKLQGVNPDTGAGVAVNATDGAISNVNGETVATTMTGINQVLSGGEKGITLSAKVSGTTVKEIYAISSWRVDADDQVDESDLAQIKNNKKLLGKKFAKDDDQNIDVESFILNGAATLDDIAEDSIVYVYTDSKSEIKRVDVGTKVVTGTITKIDGTDIYIDGTKYTEVDSDKRVNEDLSELTEPGDEVEVRLDYAGKIYKGEVTAASAGNWAVVVSKKTNEPSKSATESDTKVQLLTAEATKVYNVNGSKYVNNLEDGLATSWAAITIGGVVKYSVNDSGQVTKLRNVSELTTDYAIHSDQKGLKVTKAGYLENIKIADNATIFAVPTTTTSPKAFDYSDDDEFAVVSKDSILDTTLALVTYVVDRDTNKVVLMIVADDSTADDEFGIATSTYKVDGDTGVDFYIGTEPLTDKVLSGSAPTVLSKNVSDAAVLYKVKKTTAGEYSFDSVPTYATSAGAVTIKNGYIQTATPAGISDNLVVYIYDKSDDEFSIGSKSDISSDDVKSVAFYKTAKSDDDDYGLVNYIVIWRD